MTMAETEESIRSDLRLLGDGLNRMEYLLGCAREQAGIPEGERTGASLVADCQMNTWLQIRWEGDRLSLRADSESMLVKGALALILEIYNGRTRAETASYTCTLLDDELFSALFNPEQKKGLASILCTLKG